MGYLENYIARMTAERTTARDYKIQNARARAIRHFSEDPSALTVQALEPNGAELVTKRIRVINESVLKQLNPERVYSKFIVPHPEETMISGTILYDIYGENYLVTAITGLGEVTQQAVLQKINETMKITINNVIVEIPAVVTGISRLGDGILAMNMITLPDELIKVRVQSNTLTQGLDRNARFIIAGKVYDLTRVDRYTDEGVLNWILKEDLVEPVDFATPVVPSGIIGTEFITIGRSYDYSIDAEIATWELVELPANVVLSNTTTTSCKLTVTTYEPITFTLKATTTEAQVFTRTIKVVSLL